MHEMPVRRDAVLRRILAHGRQRDAVGEDDVAELEGIKKLGHDGLSCEMTNLFFGRLIGSVDH